MKDSLPLTEAMTLYCFAMSRSELTQDEVLLRLRKFVADHDGNRKKAAGDMAVTYTYLNDVLEKRRKPGPSILRALGLEAKKVYRPVAVADDA